jgi:cell division protein FtsQ
MSRVDAGTRTPVSRPATRPRAKKVTAPQDRLTQRKLFFRRVRRSVKPGLWVLGIICVLVVGSEMIRSLPTAAPAPQQQVVQRPAGGGMGGLAGLGAALGLRINNIEILGAKETDSGDLLQAIGVHDGDPSLGFSLTQVQQRAEQLGAVQTATVERVLPGTLIVTVTERAAYAIWQTGGNGTPAKFELIDKAGNVIANQDAAAAKRREPWLMLITGADAPQNAQTLMTELQGAPTVLSHVAAAERVDELRWNLILKNQTVVKLPELGEPDAIAELANLQTSMQLLDRPVEVIDLRLPGRLVVRPYPPAAPPSKPDHKEEHT